MADLFWLAPVLPTAVFALLALGLSRHGRLSAGLSVAALAAAAALSAFGLVAVAGGERATFAVPWLEVGGRRLQVALALDPLSALAAATVSVVGLVVFVYATAYMAEDPRRGRFFAEMSLFAGSMLLLVLASDLVTLFVAWELVGLCSYLLIGFWFERPGVPEAASKAFLVTRIGDLALLAGVLMLLGALGSGNIEQGLGAAKSGRLSEPYLVVAALLLYAGAASKSAQLPFQGWLPDAMAGPTPVSALIHSATMVAAGVFLVARFYPLFEAAGPVLSIVAWVGVATALLGAAAALVEADAKRTLAYSTMSQLGLMFVALGAGSLVAGVLLLLVQAFYKSLLFLAVGSVDHEVGSTEFGAMGGLARKMPGTFGASILAAIALAGLPMTIALPAKDPTLAAAWGHDPFLFTASLIASLGTALYSARILGLVFLGDPSRGALDAQEAPKGFVLPTLGLAILLVLVGLADSPLLGSPLGGLLGVETPEALPVTALALGTAALGFTLGLAARSAWPRAVTWPPVAPAASLFGGEFGLVLAYAGIARAFLRLIEGAGQVDRRVFDPAGASLARAARWASRSAGRVDRSTFDAFAGAAARGTMRIVRGAGKFDLRSLDATIRSSADAVLWLSGRVRRLQTGRVENYLLVIFGWSLGALLFALVGATIVGR